MQATLVWMNAVKVLKYEVKHLDHLTFEVLLHLEYAEKQWTERIYTSTSRNKCLGVVEYLSAQSPG